LGSSWPNPFVVPPCTQSASLRNRHKVQGYSGRMTAGGRFFRIV
jgi:hypothetical protein